MSDSLPGTSRTADVRAEIVARFGFVPPFFEPAFGQPELLQALWQQTRFAYVDNPLPELFKEKISAVVGRYCSVRYCLMCHTCMLRPLGMQPGAVLDLIRRPTPTRSDLEGCIGRSMRGLLEPRVRPWSAEVEADLLCLSVAVFCGGKPAIAARRALARLLTPADYNHLIALLSYNRACHEWVEAHPEVSYQLDRRYLEHYEPLVNDQTELAQLLHGDPVPTLPTLPDPSGADFLPEAEAMHRISERRLQHLVRTLNDRLRNAAAQSADDPRLQELQHEAKFAEEILAIVSHDLRNPLGVIMNISQPLMRSDDPAVLKLVPMLQRSVERSNDLISDLLDFSQARIGGGIPIDRQPMDVNDLLADAAECLARSNPDRVIRLSPCPSPQGLWDRERLHQALVNLLVNALKHSPPDSTVDLSCEGTPTEVAIRVANVNRSGPIPQELRDSLFEPFKRFSNDDANPRHSVGLGLYIVDQIVSGHGGRIELDSNQTSTTFRVILPRSRIAEEHPPHAQLHIRS